MADDAPKPSFSPARRWLTWFNTILGVIAVVALVAMANYLASGYFKRFQASASSRFQLTPQTTNLLRQVTNKVDVTIFYDQQANEEIFSLISALLKQYSYANPKISVEAIDPKRGSPGKASSLLTKYNLTTLKDKNFVVFDSGGRSKVVYGSELYDYDLSGLLSGQSQSVRRSTFRGELLFSSAIFTVAFPRPTKAYFVYGHGEHDPDNSATDIGYGKFAALLKDEANVDWAKLSLSGTNEIPDDCQLLIIAGPGRAQFAESELAKIESYLKQGRRLFVLLNNMTYGGNSGIEKILAKWNIAVLNYRITDGNSPAGDELGIIPSWLKADHPVLKSMAADKLPIYFVAPRTIYPKPVETARGLEAPAQVEVLAATRTNAVGRIQVPAADGKIQESQQTAGFPLMAAVEQGSIKNVNTDRGVTRLLVIGDSFCFDNQLLDTAANHVFASSAVNWLVDRPQMILTGIGPRPIKEYKLVLSAPQMWRLKWILLAVFPGAVLLFGGLVWLRRRN